MLVGELRNLLDGIFNDYQRYQIENVLNNAVSAVSSKNLNNPSAYAEKVQRIRAVAERISLDHSLRYASDHAKDILKKSGYWPAVPAEVARFILLNLPEDQNVAASAGEINFLLDQVKRANFDFAAFLRLSATMNLFSSGVPDDKIAIELRIPSSSIDGDVGVLGKKFEKIDQFLTAVSRGLTEGQDKPRLISVSDGSVIATLICTAVVAQSTISIFSTTVKIAAICIEWLKAMKVVQSHGTLTDVDLNQDAFREQIDKVVSKTFEAYFEKIELEEGRNVSPENRAKIAMTSVFMVQEVVGGTKLTLSITDQSKSDMLDASSKEPTGGQKLIEMSHKISKSIEKIAEAAKPLLQLTGPDDAATESSEVTEA